MNQSGKEFESQMTNRNEQYKIEFSGIILSVQPRSNVWRYRLDNRTHSMTGYNIFLSGIAEGDERDFAIAISEKQQQKLRFHIGDEIRGTAAPDENAKSPWIGEVPELMVYVRRGCRMLDSRSWKTNCFQCKWACMANVAIEYNWGITQKFRYESFCYGPKSCKLYKMGRPRAVPYKDCGSYYDEGWLDDICTEQRGYDE